MTGFPDGLKDSTKRTARSRLAYGEMHMNRRDFSRTMAGTVAFSLLHESLPVQQSASDISTVSDQAAQLYGRAPVLDCN
jgi:hypothetical protein